MKRRKASKRAALPRVTVLAYSRRDLALFVETFDRMQSLVNNLTVQVERLSHVPGRPKKTKAIDNGSVATTTTTPAPPAGA
jgi:hypothetical protein